MTEAEMGGAIGKALIVIAVIGWPVVQWWRNMRAKKKRD